MTAVPDEPDQRIRRRDLSATSARSLLLTVLGEFVLPGAAPVWTQVLLDVLGPLGVEPKSARQALARSAAEGLLASERAGRRVCWSLTENGRRLLTEGAERIYGFGGDDSGWDGRWLILLVTVPETHRRLRHRLRTRLAWAGLGSPAPGVWLSPHPDQHAEVARVIDELALHEVSFSFVGPYGVIGRQRELVRQAWDLAEVEAGYREFVQEFAGLDPASGSADEVLTAQIRLVHAWRRFPFLDPRLPAELLPGGWAGARARDLFHDRHARWGPGARARWTQLVADRS